MNQITVLPEKFSGRNSNAKIWSNQFLSYKNIFKWSDTLSIDILKISVTDEAAEWLFNMDKNLDKPNTVEQWLVLLQIEFSAVDKEDALDVYDLENLRKENSESFKSFHQRYRQVLSRIPKSYYTEDWLKLSHLRFLKNCNYQIWLEIAKIHNSESFSGICRKVEDYEQLLGKSEFELTLPVKEKSELDEITNKLEALTLLINKRKEACHKCGRKGHASDKCFSPICEYCKIPGHRAEKCFKKQASEKEKEKESKSFFTSALYTSNKRLREEELMPIVNKTEKTKEKVKTKKKSYGRSKLTDKILDAPAPLSLRELLQFRPNLLRNVAKDLHLDSKKKQETFVSNSKNQIYQIEGKINTQENTKIYLDTCSYYSLVNRNFVRKLGIIMNENEKPIQIIVADNNSAQLIHSATLNITLEEHFSFRVKAYVVPDAPFELLLGLDVLEPLSFEYSLKSYCCSFALNEKSIQLPLQLYSRNDIVEEFNSEESDSDENSEKEQSFIVIQLQENLSKHSNGAVSCCMVEEINQHFEENQRFDAEQKSKLQNLLRSFQHLFVKEFMDLPGTDVVKHKIELNDPTPAYSKPYRIPFSQQETVKKEIDKMINEGIIEPSNSPWASPIVLIPKKDGSIRFCVDYRKLNQKTKLNRWPLPHIQDCLSLFQGAQWFSVLDLFSGYWQIKMEENSKEFTTFICQFGTFQFKVMPFGLVNAPATFSQMMDVVLREFILQFVSVYLDDITIYSKSFEDHLVHLRKVFEKLDAFQLRIKLSKCQFAASEILVLGHIVSREGIAMNPKKLEALKKLKIPKNVKELRSFLGLCNYFRKFIQNFSEIALPLTELTKTKNNPYYKWGTAEDDSFSDLRRALVSAPILKHFDRTRKTILSCDASSFAVGSVLEQEFDGALHPIAFFSSKLTSPEKNYSIMEKETLAIIRSLKFFRPELLGIEFTIFTDNSAVSSILNIPMPTGRLARWIFMLSEFKFQIFHRKGKQNVVADFLSRSFVVISGNEEVPDFDPLNLIYQYLKYGSIENNFSLSQRVRTEARRYFLLEDRLYKRRKNDGPLRVLFKNQVNEVLTVLHDSLGHFGFNTLWSHVRDRYYWKNSYQDTRKFVASCEACCRFRIMMPKYRFKGSFGISGLFDLLSIDFVGPLPESNGNRYICVAILPVCKSMPKCNSVKCSSICLSRYYPCDRMSENNHE